MSERLWRDDLLEPYRSQRSPIAARNWATDSSSVAKYLHQYDVRHIAFGHSPGALNGLFGRLCQRWGTVYKADSYMSLGIEGFLEILDSTVWAIYTEESRALFSQLHPTDTELGSIEQIYGPSDIIL